MSADILKVSFSSGELSPKLFGRTDLEQYEFGMAKAQNWIVDYRGGLSTRPGLEFCEYVKNPRKVTRLFDFTYSLTDANTYIVVFGDGYVRFMQDGAYVVESNLTITGITAGGRMTFSAAHGLSAGDWIKVSGVSGISNINGRTLYVDSVFSSTKVDLKVVPTNAVFTPTGTYSSGGVANRVYTISSPYTEADLRGLHLYQIRDTVRMCHPNYPIKNLVRSGHTNWAISDEDIGETARGPTISSSDKSAAGSAGAVYCVTGILEDGTETPPSAPYRLTAADNITTVAGSWMQIFWSPKDKCVAYNVYRSVVFRDHTKMDKGVEVGFVGQVVGSSFIDNNVVPDFTIKPPNYYHPFQPGAITSIRTTAPGSTYGFGSAMTITDASGSGASAIPIANSDGTMGGVLLLRGGKNYVSPTFSASTGTGATFEATVRGMTGTYPRCSCVFQQRQLYAGSKEQPLTIWASKPQSFSNFDSSDIVVASDSFEYDLDSKEVNPILHMVPMRGGLLIMSKAGLWQLTNGQGGAVTATAAQADFQTYLGVSTLEPIKVGSDLLYIEGRGYTARLLTFNDFSKVYIGEDKCLVSNHLFDPNNPIISWAFAENPNKIIWSVKADGQLLAYTFVKEEKVSGWAPQSTRGYFESVRTITENNYDQTYFVVHRYINGVWRTHIEKLAQRDNVLLEDAVCVDAALSLGATYPAAGLVAEAVDGDDVLFTADASVFSSGDVGKYLRMGGGKALVVSYVSGTEVRGKMLRPITDTVPETDDTVPMPFDQGDWTLDATVSSVTGLYHLIGETVQILGDGNVLTDKVVDADGGITLDFPCTRVIVGLKYSSVAQTLPVAVNDAVLEGKRKRITGVNLRMYNSRGVKAGTDLDTLYEVRERSTASIEEHIPYQTGSAEIMVTPTWDENGQVYIVADYPLPVTILSLVSQLDPGDDN